MKMKQDKYSQINLAIIVPVYNASNYLLDCLNSINSQEHKKFTAFLIDDGSDDDSLSLLNEFASKHENFIVKSKRNGGVSTARNLALDLIESTGTYDGICFVDSDDVIRSNFLSLYAKAFVDYDADFVALGVEAFNKKGPIHERGKIQHTPLVLENEDIFSFVFATRRFSDRKSPASSLFIGNVAFKSNVIQNQRFDIDKRNGEDQKFILHALFKVKKAVAFSEISYLYRLRKSSLSHDMNNLSSDVGMYLDLMKREAELPEFCYRVIEERAFDAWWHSIRLSYERNELELRWDEYTRIFEYIKEKKRSDIFIKSSVRRRAFIFSLGRKAINVYFKFRRNNSSKDRMDEAFD